MEGLGINLPLLLAQVINFLLLFGLLYLFAYKPILRMFDERSQRIKESMDETEAIKEQAARAEEEGRKRAFFLLLLKCENRIRVDFEHHPFLIQLYESVETRGDGISGVVDITDIHIFGMAFLVSDRGIPFGIHDIVGNGKAGNENRGQKNCCPHRFFHG